MGEDLLDALLSRLQKSLDQFYHLLIVKGGTNTEMFSGRFCATGVNRIRIRIQTVLSLMLLSANTYNRGAIKL